MSSSSPETPPGDPPARTGLAILLAVYALLGAGYSQLMPMWEAPDETAHYQLALYRAREGAFAPRRFNHEAHQPRLYYWLAGGVLAALDRVDPSAADFYSAPRAKGRGPWPTFEWNDENYRFLPGPALLRWLDLAVGGLALGLLYWGVRRIAPGSESLALATVALAGLSPQYLHISASVSNDPLANLAGAALFCAMVELSTRRVSPPRLAACAAAALAAPALVKLTLLPVAAAVALALVLQVRRYAWDQRWRIAGFGALVALAVAASFLLLAPSASDDFFWMLTRLGTRIHPDALALLPLASWEFVWGYWGVVGMFTLGLPEPVIIAVSSLAAIGLLASLRLLAPAPAIGTRRAWAVLWAAVALALLATLRSYLAIPAAQGRHLFVCIGPLALLMTAGWVAILPAAVSRWLPLAIGLSWTAVNLHFWFAEIVPFYHQPFFD